MNIMNIESIVKKIQTATSTSLHEGASMKKSFPGKRTLSAALALALCGAISTSAQAIEFSNGEFSGSFDTTISYGAAWRASDYDDDNVGKAVHNPTAFLLDNAGQRAALGRWSVNNDDGNLNYPDGGDLVSHTIKFTSELDVTWRNFGAFTRFMGFYDFENASQDFLSDDQSLRIQSLRCRWLSSGSSVRRLPGYRGKYGN